jgi:hypothetical protein
MRGSTTRQTIQGEGGKKTAMQKVMQSFFPGFTKSDKNKGDEGDEQK